jgi:peptide/nickel transport system substrate-binding protein
VRGIEAAPTADRETEMRANWLKAALGAAGLLWTTAAPAADLTIGLAAEVTSTDPHYHNLSPNNSMAQHVFEQLIGQDEKQRLVPALAESWKALDDLTWEFKLRKGVKWHDGSDFTADDVAFTVKRAPNVPNSPSSFGIYLKQLKEVVVKDPHTIVFKTAAPYPLMPSDISNIFIVSRKHGENATTEDYNSGKAAVGTGPYRFVEWVRGDRIVLARNPAYWGKKEPWDKVTFKVISNSAARVAALLAGDVQVIESVPTADIARMKQNKDVAVVSGVSNRVIYLHVDSGREKNSPFVTDKQGKPLEKNPLRDVRVRKAISKAINRQAIVERVMEESAIPASQLLPEGFFGVSPKLKVEKYDIDGARKLLAEAGYKDGFGLTIHGPNNRYINDEKVCQAIAQMLSRAGIDTKVETMPSNVFFSRGSKLEFSLMLVGWGSGTGEASSPLKSLLATFDKDKGMGASNRGRYSNPKLDQLLDEALRTVDDKKREKLLQEATEAGINDLGIIPIHYEVSTWGTRKGLAYTARTDQNTLAMGVRPAK